MKTSSRFIALLLAIFMVAGSALTVSANRFSDVADDYDYRDAVDVLTQLGIIAGYGDGTFKPENKIERDEMAKLMYVLATTFMDAGKASANFTDTQGNWAEGFIAWCVAEKVIGGHGDGTFKPDDFVTYDQTLKMVCAVLGYVDFVSSKWPTDVRLVGIKQLHLNEGLPTGLNGSDALTRGQVAQILYNALFVNMNKTKTITLWKNDTADGTRYQINVEQAMKLAVDVWNFKTYEGTIVATEHLSYQSAATGNKDKITIAGFADSETGDTNTELDGTYELAELGLSDYEGKTDELILRSLKLFYRDDELVEKTSSVFGIAKDDVVLQTTKKSNGVADDVANLSVDGKKYSLDNFFSVDNDGRITQLTDQSTIPNTSPLYNNFPVDANDKFISSYTSADKLNLIYFLVYNNAVSNEIAYRTKAIDTDADGEYDVILVMPSAPYVVTNIKSEKDTDGVRKTFIYYDSTLAYMGSVISGKIPLELINFDGDLKEEDVFVASRCGAVMNIEQVIAPETTFVTKNAKGVLNFDGKGSESYWIQNGGTTNVFFNFAGLAPIVGVGSDGTSQHYYFYKNRIIHAISVSSTADSKVNGAIFLTAEGKSRPEYNPVDGKYYIFYPAIIQIGGEEYKVNIKSIDGDRSLSNDATNAYGGWITVPTGGGLTDYVNEYITYTIDDDGYYEIKTKKTISSITTDPQTELLLNPDYVINYLEKSGVFKIYNQENPSEEYLFTLDGGSMIYYENEKSEIVAFTVEDLDNEALLSNVKNQLTGSFAYLVKDEEESIYTLSSVMLKASLGGGKLSYKDDFTKHMLFEGTSGFQLVDDEVHRSYRYNLVMTNTKIDEASRMPASKETQAGVSGYFHVYGSDGLMERIMLDKYVSSGTSMSVTAGDGILYLVRVEDILKDKGVIFTNKDTDGIKIDEDTLIKEVFIGPKTGVQVYGLGASTFDKLADSYTYALNEAPSERVDFYIIYAYDKQTETIPYILYGSTSHATYFNSYKLFQATFVR